MRLLSHLPFCCAAARVKQPEESVYPKDNHLNEKISLFRGDITKLEVDAIVNAGE